MVMSFLAATLGLGPVFNPQNPLNLTNQQIAWYNGKIKGQLLIDTAQIHKQCTNGAFLAEDAVKALCCMLINTAYESVKNYNDKSPEFEFFRHLRNAASHNNQFNFFNNEPSFPASWSGLVFDETMKGNSNPLYGQECVGATVSPGDILALLQEIELKISLE
jgi:hypothetical protein